MLSIVYRLLIHIFALWVFAIFWLNLRRKRKFGTALSELKIDLLGLVISGLLVIQTAATLIMTIEHHFF